MPNFGVGMAIFANGKILLTQREDFEVWCLSGGGVEADESLVQTAMREVKEETGLEVRIERLVGIYSMPKSDGGGSHAIIFAGIPVGGTLRADSQEVISLGWFEMNNLPQPMLPWAVRRIKDAFSETGGSAVWRQEYIWPFPPEMKREDLYRLRDESGLSRQDFFLRHFSSEPFLELSEITPPLDSLTGQILNKQSKIKP